LRHHINFTGIERMSLPAASMSVAVTQTAVFLRIAGRANFTASVSLKKLVQELRQRGFTHFILNLSECLIMDSTFLGVLASLVSPQNPANGQQTPLAIELHNPNQRVLDLLDCLGILTLFKINSSSPDPVATFQPLPANGTSMDKIELSRTSLEAHRTLMALNPNNAAKFKDVAQFLEEDLQRFEAEKKAER
jgi:anti-sigma B factor antagonist